MPSLVDRCGQFLGENLDATNVFSILPFAQKELETDYQCRDNLFYIMASKTLLYSWRFKCTKSDIITVTAACVLNLKLKFFFSFKGCKIPLIMYESLFMTLKGLSWGNQ